MSFPRVLGVLAKSCGGGGGGGLREGLGRFWAVGVPAKAWELWFLSALGRGLNSKIVGGFTTCQAVQSVLAVMVLWRGEK